MSSHRNNTAYMGAETWPETICQKNIKDIIHSSGIWDGDNPLDFVLPLVLLQWLLAFLASRAVYFLLRPLKQPKIVCHVLGGILLGPSGLGRNQAFKEKVFPALEKIVLDTMASIGEVYFLFLISTKMDVTMLLREGIRNGWSIGSTGFAFSFVSFSFLISSCINYIGGVPSNAVVPFLMALALSISYFPVVAYALGELNLVTSELGQLALSFATVNDVILWSLAPLAIVFLQNSVSQSLVAFLVFSALTIFTIFVLRPIMLLIVKKTPEGEPVREVYVVLVLVGALVMGFLSDAIGLNFSAGAQLLGYIIPEGPPLASILVEKSELFVAQFLMPFWYLRIGLEVDVHSITNWKSFVLLQGILFIGYFAKFLGVVLASISSRINPRRACLLGLIMNIKGVIDLLIFFRWKASRHVIDEQSYAVLVFSSLAITAIVTPWIEMSCKQEVGRPDPENEGQSLRSIQNTLRTTEFRVICCVHSEENVHGLISLLEASNPTEESPICAYVIHLSDLVGRATPLLLPYNKHKKLRRIKNTRSFGSDHILRAFVNFSKNSNGPVTIQPFTMIAAYKTMHENILRLAQDKFVHLIIIPYHENQRATQGIRVSSTIRDLNANLQTYATCTVGVLVERGLRSKSCTHFSYHVAVIFIGGQDDREALAYALRMSSHPNVNLSVMRIIMCKKKEDESQGETIDRLRDEASFSNFKSSKDNIGDGNVVCREIMVEDIVRVVDAIRSMGKNFDLVMVGRRHRDIEINDNEMTDFVEHDDLGMIGDVLASSEFFGDLASVLVLQHCRNLNQI